MPSRSFLHITLILLLLLSPEIVRAQNPPVTYYTVEQGLPSGEVYGVEFDSMGVLWAATDRGIARYDGYHFKQFTVADGLPDNTILSIYKDASKRIWFSSIWGDVLYVQNDSVIVSPVSSSLRTLSASKQYIQRVTQLPDQSLMICFNRPGLLKIHATGEQEWIQSKHPTHKNASVVLYDSLGYFFWDMIQYPTDDPTIKTLVYKEGNRTYITCGTKHNLMDFRKYYYPIGKDEFLFTCGHKVFHIKNGALVSEVDYPFEVMSVFVDNQKGFWVAIDRTGVDHYPDGNLKQKPKRYFADELVTCIRQDHEGNYWFSTRGNGILMVKSFNLASYSHPSYDPKDQVVTSIAVLEDRLYFGTLSGQISFLETDTSGSYVFEQLSFVGDHGSCRELIPTQSNTLFVLKDTLWEITRDGKMTGFGYQRSYPYTGLSLPDNQIIISGSGIFWFINPDRSFMLVGTDYMTATYPDDPRWLNLLKTVRTMYHDSSGRLWVGSHYAGVYTWEGDRFFYWGEVNDQLKNRTRDIIQVGDRMIFATNANGLLVMNSDSTTREITEEDNLSSDIVDILYADNDSVFWAGTNRGLNRIELSEDVRKEPEIKHFTFAEGLPSNRIYGIATYNKRHWLATSKGLVSFDDQFTEPLEVLPKLVLENIVVNNKITLTEGKKIFSGKEDKFEFNYKAITYRDPNAISYRYRLEPFEDQWNYTNNLTARYPKLPGNSYVFYIQASYKSDDWTNPGISYSFIIRKQFYETFQFYIGVICVFLLLLYISINHFIRGVKLRGDRKLRLLMAEKRALVAQMNPHFIFNSLNSIQYFILQNDEFQANNFLTNFSSLIRRILENSRKNLIPLSESLETLQLYLTMEKLRFEDKFEFEIQIDPDMEVNEILIPPMMLQPIVENAIWHGITPLQKNGHITISFKGNVNYYECVIQDDGIGRAKSEEMKGSKKHHESTGVKNIMERIDLMNQMNKKEISCFIEDLKNPDGTAAGTRVIMKFPLKWD